MVPKGSRLEPLCDSSYHGRTCDEGEEGIGRRLAGGPSESGSRSSQCLRDTSPHLQEVQEEISRFTLAGEAKRSRHTLIVSRPANCLPQNPVVYKSVPAQSRCGNLETPTRVIEINDRVRRKAGVRCRSRRVAFHKIISCMQIVDAGEVRWIAPRCS